MKTYTVRTLKVDDKLVKAVMGRRKKGESIGETAKALKVSTGKAAMAEMIGTEKRRTITDPVDLAKAIAEDRWAGASWGRLAARYGVTEATARAAYEAATGEPFSAIDYRRQEMA